MPKSKEFIESESDSDSSVEKPKTKKKKVEKSAKGSGDSASSSKQRADKEGNVMFQLSTMRFASVSQFRGKKLINIREYYEADGDLKPGKKGIALSLEQWQALKQVVPDIDEALEEL